MTTALPTYTTSRDVTIRTSVGSVGNICPRSIFDSIAGDSPVCCPSWTSPSDFFNRSLRIRGPIS